MTNEDIRRIALAQSAADLNADPQDFEQSTNVIAAAGIHAKTRKYYKEPMICTLVSYGSNIVASVQDKYKDLVKEYMDTFTFFHCFETPNIHWLDDRFQEYGQRVCFMAEYWLPDLSKLTQKECPYPTKLLTQKDFVDLYVPEWGNALCKDRKELDVLGIGAFDGDRMIGFAACSADCEDMWQIGVDVLPEYRRQGIASALTSNLALEILVHGKVPFYCCAWSNLRSAKNAVKSGFVPAWVELSVKPVEYVDMINRGREEIKKTSDASEKTQ